MHPLTSVLGCVLAYDCRNVALRHLGNGLENAFRRHDDVTLRRVRLFCNNASVPVKYRFFSTRKSGWLDCFAKRVV